MRRLFLPFLVAVSMAGSAAAHEVWVEQDDDKIRVYLGEPDKPVPEGGEPAFDKLQTPLVFRSDPAKRASLTRRADHLEARLDGRGDVRVRDDRIFPPWKSGDKLHGAVYYGRAGRQETQAKLDLEIVP